MGFAIVAQVENFFSSDLRNCNHAWIGGSQIVVLHTYIHRQRLFPDNHLWHFKYILLTA